MSIDLKSPNEIDLNKHGLIEASAGTGKTYTIENLVVRYILEKNLKVEDLLIVTFTEKATSELKNKIRSALFNKMGDTSEPNKKILMSNILSFDKAPIYTIHGFCNYVLQEYPFENNEYFNFKIADDKKLINSHINEFIAKDLLVLWGSDFSSLYELVNFQEVYDLVKCWVDHPKYEYYNQDSDFDASDSIKKVKSLINNFYSKNNSIIETISLAIDSESFKKNIIKIENKTEIINSLTSFFIESQININFTLIKKIKSSNVLKSKQTDEIVNCLNNFSEFISLLDYQINHIKFNLGVYCAASVVQKINEHLKEEGLMTFNKLVSRCRDLVCDEDKSSNVLDSLREKFKVIMVDEFQDTDILQWDIFSKVFLTDSNQLFLIGDPKQSIYKFRNADIETYNEAKNTMLMLSQENKSNIYHLSTNYRSCPRLVDTFNSVFKYEEWFGPDSMITYQDVQSSPKNVNHPSVANNFRKPGIKCIPIAGGKTGEIKNDYIKFIANEILLLKGKNKNLKFSNFCILIDKKRAFENITRLFDQYKIPTRLYKQEGIKISQELLEIDFLIHAIADHKNKSKVACALLTPFFGKTSEEIEYILSDSGGDCFEMRLIAQWANYLSELNIGKMFYSILHDSLLVKSCYETFGGDRNFSAYHQILESFIFESIQFTNSSDFLLFWNDYKLSEESNDSVSDENKYRLEGFSDKVTVMTMFVSKGLQFDYVFNFPSSGKSSGPNKPVWFHNGDKISIATKVPEKFKEKLSKESMNEFNRIQYVAFTRAIHSLYTPIANIDSNIAINKYFLNVGKLLKDLVAKNEIEGLDVIDPYDQESYSLEHSLPQTNTSMIQINDLLKSLDLYSRKIEIQSYSMLARNVSFGSEVDAKFSGISTKNDDDEIVLELENTLRGGKNTGNLIHTIYENIDFSYILKLSEIMSEFDQITDDPTLKECILPIMSKFDFSVSDYDKVLKIVWSSLTAKIFNFDKEFSLCQLSKEQRCHEMEFDLAFDKNSCPYMHGFIDLVFEWKGKYHILDWKSNMLSRYDNYELESSIKGHKYDLQAEIYLDAIQKWLELFHRKNTLGAIGGVHYYFVRGAEEEKGVYTFDLEKLRKRTAFNSMLVK